MQIPRVEFYERGDVLYLIVPFEAAFSSALSLQRGKDVVGTRHNWHGFGFQCSEELTPIREPERQAIVQLCHSLVISM
jgi:hypothetical protein